MLNKPESNTTYDTTVDVDSADIGSLTTEDISKLLIACQNAIKEQYPVAGSKDIWSKIHNGGEYGAYRLTINQLIDASWVGILARDYIEKTLIDRPEGPEKLETRKSYFETAKEKYGTELDFAESKIETKNSGQYYFITTALTGIPINARIQTGYDILKSKTIQDEIAFDYLKFIYNLLYNARIVNDSTDNDIVAGLLSVALCVNYDTAANYANGIIKKDTTGVTSKYWYDIGYNSVSSKPLQVSIAKPDVPDLPTVDGALSAVENTIGNLVVEYTAVGTDIAGRILYDGKEIAVSRPVSITSLSAQLDKVIQAARITGLLEKSQLIQSAKTQIVSSFDADIAPIKKQLKIVDPSIVTVFDAAGNSIVTTITENPDGTKTTVVETVSADGTLRTKETTSEKIALETKEEEPDVSSPPPTQVQNAADSDTVNADNSTDTFRANNQPKNTDVLPPDKQDDTKGFKDPNSVYPHRSSVNKPDTNPLATGVNSPQVGKSPKSSSGNRETLSAGASPAARNASRKREVQTAGRNGVTWAQPESPYNAQYPFNKVFGSESGHAMEIDDTPGSERLNWAHRSGTFDEIGPNGTKVTKIVGDGYTILDKNGYILIEGIANVHVAGNCNVIIMSDTNLTMHGKVSMDIHNDVDVNIAGRLSLSVADGIYARNGGSMSLENIGDIDIDAKGNMTTDVTGKFNLTSDAGVNVTSKADTHIKSAGSFFNHSTGDTNLCTDAAIKTKSGAATEIKSGAAVNVESAGDTNIKSGGALNTEAAGNTSLKAVKVLSSDFNAPTIDVSTLNAASTNLRATGTDTGTNGGSTHNLPVAGTASVAAPAAAATATEAVCAVAAPLSTIKTVEKPVSKSVTGKSQYVGGAAAAGVSGGSQGVPDNTENDVPDEPDSGTEDCIDKSDPSQPSGPGTSADDAGGDGAVTGDFGKVPDAIPGCNIYYKTKDPMPPLGGGKITGNIKLSDNYILDDFFSRAYYPRKLSQFIPYKRDGKTISQWDIIQNYRCLCLNILEPLRERYPGFRINSGFRHDTNSAHRYSAVDIQWGFADNRKKMIEIAKYIATSLPKCDQILLETASGKTAWIHIGWNYYTGAKRGGTLNGTAKLLSNGKTKITSPGNFTPW
jgi:hypothetical protein